MGYDSSDLELEWTYRRLSSAHLKRSAAALELQSRRRVSERVGARGVL